MSRVLAEKYECGFVVIEVVAELKMNSAKRSVSCAAFLGLMLMLSATANAEYGALSGYNSSVNSPNINTDVLKPSGLAIGGNAAAAESALEASLRASLEKTGEIIQRSAEERELRGKVDGAKRTIENKQKSILAIQKAQDDKIKNSIEANKADLARINSIAPAQGNTGSDINTNQMEASCKIDVDFTASNSLSDTMGSQYVQYLKDESINITQEENKVKKAQRAASVAKLFDSLQKFQDDNKAAEAFAQPIQQRSDLTKGDNSLATGLNQLKAEWENQKSKQLPDINNQLTKTIKDTVLGAVALDDAANDEDFVKLKTQFSDSVRGQAKIVKTSFRKGGDQLLANCEKNVDQLGRGNPLSASSWTNSAYQFAAKVSPKFANDTLLPLLNNFTRPDQTRCTDVSQNIEALFGAPMEAAIEIVRSSRDKKALINNAFALVTTISNAQAQIGTALKPLIDDCGLTARNLKTVKDYVGQVKTQSEQAKADAANQPPGAAGVANRNRTNGLASGGNNGSTGSRVHTPVQQPGRRF